MAEAIPETLFEQIYRRAPTDADRARLTGIKAALGLSERDELWPVILTFDHYSWTMERGRREMLKALETLPALTQAAVHGVEKEARIKSDYAVAQIVEKSAERISTQMVKHNQTTADTQSTKRTLILGITTLVLALVFMGLGAVIAWFYIELHIGMCSGPKGLASDGLAACYVD
ncbi:hypothetical protein EOK75_20185 (plasmid) [Pseudorhodobacter turbinis]|uniref:Uncharacterized protein n=1 Tax=Pseudorhodobacter turbinis TaxID=2500533 RepID=A0A4P8ELU7_9RHOB|nr:hypothetical protein [Pseudorhodobacter turbinis]QCO58088.1 hypothetical protein EOK75_20185 [Pseudorhodobacter turbinis]